MKAEFSFRYAVIGFYLDRGGKILRVYPVPFVRISLEKK
jgi:hypothetical protein